MTTRSALRLVMVLAVSAMTLSGASATAQGPWQAPGTITSHFHCGAYTQSLTDLKARECVIVSPTPSGAYVQSVITVDNVGTTARTLSGFTYAFLGSYMNGPQLSYTDCGDITIAAHWRQWCFSRTTYVAGHNRAVGGRGHIYNYHYGQGVYVDSPIWKT